MDINADLGEGGDSDALLMPLIDRANIACGGHAGDRASMRAALRLVRQYGVKAGAHPSYPDRTGFGRIETGASPNFGRRRVTVASPYPMSSRTVRSIIA
jgi:UPF0271 protein